MDGHQLCSAGKYFGHLDRHHTWYIDKFIDENDGSRFEIQSNSELCENLAINLKNQIETCPDGGFLSTSPHSVIGNNKDCSTP